NTALFSGGRIARMAEQFAVFAQALVQSPALPLGQAPLLTEAEWLQLQSWHGKAEALPGGCLHQLVEAQAESNPTAIAVVDAEQQLTYGELNAQANRLARYLREQRLVESETLVGICLGRSSALLVAILAVLKAGGAYVPLDPEYPQQRLALMQADAALGTVLTLQSQAADWLPSDSRVALDSVAVQASLAGYADDNLNLVCQPEQLAYVIYTSGSTGTPKGVMVEHRNLINYQQHMLACYQMQASDRVLQFSTPNFDIFVEEFIAALCNGAVLVLRSDARLEGPQAFSAFGTEQGVTVISLPTAFFHELQSLEPQWAWPSLRLVIVGGEALSANLAGRFIARAPQARLLNTYGPTETTITATSFAVQSTEEPVLPIGMANLNTRVYVLDSQQQPVPVGVSGELYVGGAGVARGYLNR
ncbi:amino acid adenylation domain-containing protein, partial [Rheinheimera pacifica]|uniref:amino acid adenylation domain-containing protein n=1 Tax=Rheinheimera pacifica TaxID=173990 RepID=UPI0028614AD1